MTEPQCDDRTIPAVPQEFHRDRVSQDMRAYPFAFE